MNLISVPAVRKISTNNNPSDCRGHLTTLLFSIFALVLAVDNYFIFSTYMDNDKSAT